jgi:hypothetical protein
MLCVALLSGLLPNLLTSRLSTVFTPTAMSVPTFAQPLLAAIVARLVGLQALPGWPVWLVLVLLLVAQVAAREAVVQAGNVALDDRSVDSQEQPPKHALMAPVLV